MIKAHNAKLGLNYKKDGFEAAPPGQKHWAKSVFKELINKALLVLPDKLKIWREHLKK